MNITTKTAPFLLVLAACASGPASPSPFHAPALQEPVPPAESPGQPDETALSDVAPGVEHGLRSAWTSATSPCCSARATWTTTGSRTSTRAAGLLGVDLIPMTASGLGSRSGLHLVTRTTTSAQDVEARSRRSTAACATIPLDSSDIHPYVGIGATVLHAT
jgi:hypothetical protein